MESVYQYGNERMKRFRTMPEILWGLYWSALIVAAFITGYWLGINVR
jgi:hypothetical protein